MRDWLLRGGGVTKKPIPRPGGWSTAHCSRMIVLPSAMRPSAIIASASSNRSSSTSMFLRGGRIYKHSAVAVSAYTVLPLNGVTAVVTDALAGNPIVGQITGARGDVVLAEP
jgi:hypothetical protein